NFIILNLPPKLSSLLSNIHPFAVCRTIDIHDLDFDFVLNLFMKEIAELESENGLALNVPELGPFSIKGTIVGFCGDTKGAHEIGGFMSPSANKLCRLCLINRAEINVKSRISDLDFRTRENYDAAAAASQDDVKSIPLTGVKYASLLNESKYFHIAENLIMDGMHDFFEGVGPFTIMLCLQHLSQFNPELEINAAFLNKRIERFQYGYSDLTNKPSPRFDDKTLKKIGSSYSTRQRASQNWCLIKIFPFLIADKVPQDNKFYRVFLTLRKIMDIVFSPVVAMGHTVDLECLITEYFEQFEEAYPDVQGINKMHHMHHYVILMRAMGPAIRYWCMRFEAYHNKAKRLAQVNFNFKNITLSVANHLQASFCASMLTGEMFDMDRIETGPLVTHVFRDLFEYDVLLQNSLDPEALVNVAKWVKVSGWDYRSESVILIKYSHSTNSGLPEFAKIVKVLMLENREILIQINSLNTVCFNAHYHSFEVENTNPLTMRIMSLKKLPECEPLYIMRNNEKNCAKYFLSPRHII
ncbi:MAG: hypothetical protein ACK518_00865, partial [bacterium]